MNFASALAGTALYTATAIALILLARRYVRPVTTPAALVLGAIPLSFTGRALLTGRVYAPSDLLFLSEPFASYADYFGVKPANGLLGDVATLIIPLRHVARLAITRGEWPLWNPFCAAGDILAAQAQSAPYDPFFLLSLLLPEPSSWTFLASTTLLVAAISMFLFLREIGCGEWASAGGSAAFALCMFITVFLQWPVGPANAVLPLVLLGVRRMVRSPGPNATGILTVAFAKLLFSGHPESALHVVTGGLLWSAGELWAVRFRGFVKSAALAMTAAVLAFLLSAIFMLPFLEALPRTQEYQWRKAVLPIQVRSLPADRVLKKLVSQFVPFIGGEPHRELAAIAGFDVVGESAYAGSAALALAALGMWRSRWRGRWLALVMITVGLLLGTSSWPAADWIARIPLFTIGINERLIVLAAFGIAVLAALGCQAAIAEPDRRRLWLPPLIVFFLLGGVAAAFIPVMRGGGLRPAYIATKFLHLLVPPLLVAGSLAVRRQAGILGLALAVIITGQRAFESATFYPTWPAPAFYPAIPLLERLPRGGEPYRIVGVGPAFTPQSSAMYGLEDVRMYTGMTLDLYDRQQSLWSVRQPAWYNRVDDLKAPFLSLLNVRYALAPRAASPPDGWSVFTAERNTQILENHRVLSRAFLPHTVVLGDDRLGPFDSGIEPQRDYGERSWIDVHGDTPHEEKNGTGSLSIEKAGLGTRIIRARLDADAWTIISESAWPGWRAYVDAKPAKLRIANGMLLALHLPAGQHTVRLVYLPRAFVRGRAISAITLMALLTTAIVAAIRKRRLHASSSP